MIQMTKKNSVTLLFSFAFVMLANAQTYNYYFGNIHAHSSYSDGNKDSSTSHLTRPIQDFIYAKASQHVDFYGISEHNHLQAGMDNKANYHRGLADADSINDDSSFVAMYGMEWGVISGGGHVIVYGYDSLMGWDTNDYDVYVAKNDYTNLWKKINEKPGSFGYLAHPQNTDYNNLFSTSVSLLADNAIVGMAARSGPAFSINTSYSDPDNGTYISRYNDALRMGYHLGIGLDHDTHNSVFGRQTHGRLVVLAATLTRANVLDAIRKMRFYSSDDWNVKVNFTISSQPMGSIFAHTGTPTITATITDPDVSESVSSIAIYYGVPGSGTAPTVLNTVSSSATISYAHSIANNSTYYYYLKITQADGDVIWTSPIWYTRNDAITNTPPVADFTPSSVSACVGQPITFNDNSTNGPTNWSWSLNNALPNVSSNQSVIATYTTPGTYSVSLTVSNSFGTSATTTKTVAVSAIPTVAVVSNTICQGQTDTLTATGANSYSWNTGSTNSTISVAPTVTTIYTVTGTTAGCSKTVPGTVTVQVCTGIDKISESVVKIFPNPASQSLTIDVSSLTGKKIIEIIDVTGKLILTKTGNESVFNLDVSSYDSGNYFVRLISDTKTYIPQKFIIQRK
jgi:PKD repeat protein